MPWRVPEHPSGSLRVVSWCVEGFEKQDIEHNLRKLSADIYLLQKQFDKLWCPSYFSLEHNGLTILSRIPLTQPKNDPGVLKARMVIPSGHTLDVICADVDHPSTVIPLININSILGIGCAMPEIRSYLTVYRVWPDTSQCKDNVIATTTNLLITDSVCVPRTGALLAHIVKKDLR